MRITVMLGMALALSGCVTAQQRQAEILATRQQLQTARQQCWNGAGGNLVTAVRCVNAAENRILRPIHPSPDLLDVVQSQRMVLANQVQNREISLDEANARYAQIESQATSEQTRRHQGAALVSAQQSAAFFQGIAAIAASQPQQPSVVPMPPPPRQSINCTRTGNTVNCM